MCLTSVGAMPILGLMTSMPIGHVAMVGPGVGAHDIAAIDTDWVEEFERFADRRPVDADAVNGIVVAKVGPEKVAPEKITPQTIDTPQDAPAAATPAPVDVARSTEFIDPVVTGSIKPPRSPLLPPVPGSDAFKAHKGDRLTSPGGSEPAHAAPIDARPASEAAPPAPHAGMTPPAAGVEAKWVALVPLSKPATAHPETPAHTETTASLVRRTPLPPLSADPLFAHPPAPPPDPATDPDAPVLGYADQLAKTDAPFRSLFAGPRGQGPLGAKKAEIRAWEAVAPSQVKPARTREVRLIRHRPRHLRAN